MSKQERFFALKIASIMAFRLLGLFMILPIFSVYAKYYDDTTPYLIGLAIGIYGLTQALLQIPFGYLSDQFGRKPLLIIGLVIFFIGSVIAANATDIVSVVIGRALQGSGAISSVLMAFLADYVSAKERAKANAFVGMQIGAAFALSLLISPIIVVNIGISGLFWVISALAIAALLIVATLPNIKPQQKYALSISNFKQVLNADLLRFDFSIFALHLVLTCTFIVLPLFLVDNNIIAIKDNWQLYLPVIMLSFIGMLPLIILAGKFKKTKMILMIAITMLLISQISFYSLAYIKTIFTPNYMSFFVLLSLFFIAFNALEALLPSLVAKTADSEKRGLAMGLFSSSQFFGAFVGGICGGLIYNTLGLNSVFLLSVFIIIIWWIIMLKIKPSKLI